MFYYLNTPITYVCISPSRKDDISLILSASPLHEIWTAASTTKNPLIISRLMRRFYDSTSISLSIIRIIHKYI